MPRQRETKNIDGQLKYKCTTCEKWFGKESFYKTKRGPHFIGSECKKCHCITSIASRNGENHRNKNRQWMRDSKYHRRPEVKERSLKFSRVKNKSWEAKSRA